MIRHCPKCKAAFYFDPSGPAGGFRCDCGADLAFDMAGNVHQLAHSFLPAGESSRPTLKSPDDLWPEDRHLFESGQLRSSVPMVDRSGGIDINFSFLADRANESEAGSEARLAPVSSPSASTTARQSPTSPETTGPAGLPTSHKATPPRTK